MYKHYKRYYQETFGDTTQLFNELLPVLPLEKFRNTGRSDCTLGDKSYTFSGITRNAHPIPKILDPILKRLIDKTNINFNIIHCNYYKDGSVGLGRHTDNESEHKSDYIISISLGASRTFTVNDGTGILLEDGDLVLFNRHMWHGIQKDDTKLPRLSLTFREFK